MVDRLRKAIVPRHDVVHKAEVGSRVGIAGRFTLAW